VEVKRSGPPVETRSGISDAGTALADTFTAEAWHSLAHGIAE
jgi:hypothetical protein